MKMIFLKIEIADIAIQLNKMRYTQKNTIVNFRQYMPWRRE